LERFPRELDSLERELLLWVLPGERPGYAEYRKFVETWPVVAAGRRGEGNFVLAEAGWTADIESPLPQLFAYGVVELERGSLTISVRERSGGQLEFEMAGVTDRATVTALREIRRWSFSEWLPSQPCPSCRSSVREIRMATAAAQTLVLALCSKDRRIWVYDGRSGVNALIPVTGFYNELMLQTGVHDPNIALNPTRLFELPGAQGDAELIRAFSSYNKLRNKVVLQGDLVVVGERKLNWIKRVAGALAGEKEKAGQRKES
jgi:hypothetical protein